MCRTNRAHWGVRGGRIPLKMVVASVAGVVALGVTAGPALADCANVSRSDTANVQIAANSPITPSGCGSAAPCTPHRSLDETLLIIFQAPASFAGPLGLGLCPQGAQYLVDQIDAAAALPGSGIDLAWVTSFETLQSGGILNNSNPRALQNLSNGKGIDLLGENAEILAVVNTNLATATGICGL